MLLLCNVFPASAKSANALAGIESERRGIFTAGVTDQSKTFAISVTDQSKTSTAGVMGQQKEFTGVVLDENREPVPYATLYIEGTSIGTSANAEGRFSISTEQLKAQKSLTLIIRAVGYRQTSLRLSPESGESKPLEIILEKEIFRMEEVSVVKQEDPAYAIIRKAIKNRKKHLEEFPPHTARVYIKGVHRMLQAPSKLMGMNITEIGSELGLDSNRTGILYLSESESKITVSPPRHFREEMISSTVAGSNNGFSINRAADLQVNFYENHQQIVEELSPRPFVSPIADNALSYYRYQYLGFHEEDGLTINKIRVIPRRKAEPVYEGDIYIIEDSWRIYGLQLLLTKDAGINFVDSLSIRQEFIPVDGEIWMPASIRFDFQGGIFGFRIGGQFAAVFSDYRIGGEPLPKSAFRELLRIDADVNKKDSAYWAEHRPLALTEEEQLDYIKKDSLRRRRESPAYLDSLDRRSNRFRPLGFLLNGYSHSNRAKRTLLTFGSPLSSFSYNTVEGAAISYGASYRKRLDSLTAASWVVAGQLRYGFANHRVNGQLSTSFPVGKQSSLTLGGGSSVEDLNSRGSIPSMFNTYYTLFFGENPMKLYERGFARITWSRTLPSNVQLSLSSLYEDRRWLENSSSYAFIAKRHRHFTPNNPFANETGPTSGLPGTILPNPPGLPDQPGPLFDRHQALRATVALSYDFSTRYQTFPSGRRYLPSKYPRLTLVYTRGIAGLFGSDTGFDLIRANLQKTDVRLGLYGQISYSFSAGTFLGREEKPYPDRWHFKGTGTLVSNQSLTSFLLLDPYLHSTSTRFAEAHAEYNLSTILTSKIPLVRRLKLQEILGIHLLKTGEISSYGEVHIGLERQTFRVIYARSFGSSLPVHSGQTLQHHAIRIGLPLL